MWQAIRKNTRRSRTLVALMGVTLIGIGALLGRLAFGPDGVPWGVGFAFAMWLALLAIAYLGGDTFILASAGAKEIQKDDSPRLWNVVEEMTIASGLGQMPRVYIVDSYLQNAFATGRTLDTARVVVTDGLIRRLTRDELQGVVAHEIGHIRNLDIRFMTLASVMLGSITLVSDALRRFIALGGTRRSRLRGPFHFQLVLAGVALVVSILAPIFARLLYLACSREREFLADASAARFTRYPAGLASALLKISDRVGVLKDDAGLRALAPMYIVNPLRSVESSRLFSTHPSTQQRVEILQSMAGAGWKDYEEAYRGVFGWNNGCLDEGLWESEKRVAIREAEVEDPEPLNESIGRVREVADLLDRGADFLLMPCPCGVRIKVPPDFGHDAIACPRCGQSHAVPQAAHATTSGNDAPLEYQKRGNGWDSFRCSCGKVVHLSPAIREPRTRCTQCGTLIQLTGV